jgi:hypothetical protein
VSYFISQNSLGVPTCSFGAEATPSENIYKHVLELLPKYFAVPPCPHQDIALLLQILWISQTVSAPTNNIDTDSNQEM